jgi:hypothetical protein
VLFLILLIDRFCPPLLSLHSTHQRPEAPLALRALRGMFQSLFNLTAIVKEFFFTSSNTFCSVLGTSAPPPAFLPPLRARPASTRPAVPRHAPVARLVATKDPLANQVAQRAARASTAAAQARPLAPRARRAPTSHRRVHQVATPARQATTAPPLAYQRSLEVAVRANTALRVHLCARVVRLESKRSQLQTSFVRNRNFSRDISPSSLLTFLLFYLLLSGTKDPLPRVHAVHVLRALTLVQEHQCAPIARKAR